MRINLVAVFFIYEKDIPYELFANEIFSGDKVSVALGVITD